jgi:hypothetical protein
MSDEQMKVAKNGRPWTSEDAARKAMAEQELNPLVWGGVQRDGGWVSEQHAQTLKRQADAKAQASSAAKQADEQGEKYFWVEFGSRTSANEAENVELSHNGDRITIRRDTPVPLPQRYLNVADGAVQRIFEPVRRSSIPYREAGVIKRRAYRVLREATREEFLKYMEEGNNVTRAAILASGGRAATDGEA